MVVFASSVFFFVMVGCPKYFDFQLWTKGEGITPGEVVAAGSVALRIMMMAGWVSFSLMTIYTNLGDVQDAMQTLAVPHTMIDKALLIHFWMGGTRPKDLSKAKSNLTGFPSRYGRNIGGLKDVSLRIKADSEKLGVVAAQASGAGNGQHSSLHFSGFMMLRVGQSLLMARTSGT